jgi:hypothetical protein
VTELAVLVEVEEHGREAQLLPRPAYATCLPCRAMGSCLLMWDVTGVRLGALSHGREGCSGARFCAAGLSLVGGSVRFGAGPVINYRVMVSRASTMSVGAGIRWISSRASAAAWR